MFILLIVDLSLEKIHNTVEARIFGVGYLTEVSLKLRDFKQEEQQFVKDGCKCIHLKTIGLNFLVLLSSTWVYTCNYC